MAKHTIERVLAAVQGPVAYGVKLEDRIRIRRGLKARVSGGMVTCQTRMGRETAVGSNGEIKYAGIKHACRGPYWPSALGMRGTDEVRIAGLMLHTPLKALNRSSDDAFFIVSLSGYPRSG